MSDTIENYYECKLAKKLQKQRVINPCEKTTDIEYGSRVLLVEPSGSGKTTIVCEYLARASGCFHRVWFLVKQPDEPLYELIKKSAAGDVRFISTLTDFPSLNPKNSNFVRESLQENQQVLLVVDDFLLEAAKSKEFSQYFIRGRKMGCTLFFLSQDYYTVPKLLRQQITHLLLLKISNQRDISSILKETGIFSNAEVF
jgi:ABC-type dipeptide/oligopeptide/nickel transport system ATPase subunit